MSEQDTKEQVNQELSKLDEHLSPSRKPQDHDPSREDRLLKTAELLIGTTMIFVGFLNVFLSISGGFEISVFPFLLYFAGMAIWAHATIQQQTTRYAVIAGSLVLGLAIFHYGEVLFWHKQVVFWGTVAMVSYFMFKGTQTS
jgi:hypothetical protein